MQTIFLYIEGQFKNCMAIFGVKTSMQEKNNFWNTVDSRYLELAYPE